MSKDKLIKIFSDHINNLQITHKELMFLIESDYKKTSFELNNDARFTFLTQWNRVIIVYKLQIITLLRQIGNPNLIQELFKVEFQEYKDILGTNMTYNRLAYIMIFHSILENFLRNVYQAVFGKNCYNLKQIIDELSNFLGFDKTSDKYTAVYLLRFIRNTSHNNGIFTYSRKETIKYRNKSFNFELNKPHQAASLGNIENLSFDIFHFCKDILKHPEILKLDYINDPSNSIILSENLQYRF